MRIGKRPFEKRSKTVDKVPELFKIVPGFFIKRQELFDELFYAPGCQKSQQKTSIAENLALTSNA